MCGVVCGVLVVWPSVCACVSLLPSPPPFPPHRLGMCGTNGQKLPGIMQHMDKCITQVYEGLDASVIETWPPVGVVDRKAFKTAAAAFQPGDCAIIFTPDDTHFEIAMECIERGMHVMITKPPVKTLEEHAAIAEAAARKGVLCVIEVHKRYDPMYADAADRIHLPLP